MDPFFERVVMILRQVPPGRVVTYGAVAAMAGNARAARQVARVLHALADKEGLPWHRVVNAQGRISLRPGRGRELQRALLEEEGIEFDDGGAIDLQRFLWLAE